MMFSNLSAKIISTLAVGLLCFAPSNVLASPGGESPSQEPSQEPSEAPTQESSINEIPVVYIDITVNTWNGDFMMPARTTATGGGLVNQIIYSLIKNQTTPQWKRIMLPPWNNIPSDSMRLFYEGEPLVNDRSLTWHNITTDVELYLVWDDLEYRRNGVNKNGRRNGPNCAKLRNKETKCRRPDKVGIRAMWACPVACNACDLVANPKQTWKFCERVAVDDAASPPSDKVSFDAFEACGVDYFDTCL